MFCCHVFPASRLHDVVGVFVFDMLHYIVGQSVFSNTLTSLLSDVMFGRQVLVVKITTVIASGFADRGKHF